MIPFCIVLQGDKYRPFQAHNFYNSSDDHDVNTNLFGNLMQDSMAVLRELSILEFVGKTVFAGKTTIVFVGWRRKDPIRCVGSNMFVHGRTDWDCMP